MSTNQNQFSWLRPLRYIDAKTKDFIYDNTKGHALFPSVTSQRVYITMAKILFSTNKVNKNFGKIAKMDIANELQFLVDAGKISEVEVETESIPGGITVNVSYINNESKKGESVSINPDF